MSRDRPAGVIALLMLGIGLALPAQAWVLTVTPGAKTIYLQVAAGTKDAANATINVVSVSVPAAQVGTGATQAMTSDSATSISFFDNYVVCNPPQQVYVGGYLRAPNNSASAAVLQVTTPTSLTNATGDTLPFSSISWTSTANGNATADIPAGTFSGATQLLRNIAPNTWVENCLVFSYANTTVVPAGTYQGRATYTLTAP